MGNVLSSDSSRERASENVMSESETMDTTPNGDASENGEEEFHDTLDEDATWVKCKEDEMNEFRKQLNIKREQRKEILTRHRTEKEDLIKSLENERKAKLDSYERNRMLRDLLMSNNIEIPEELQSIKEDSIIAETLINMKEEFDQLKTNNFKLRKDLVESNCSLQNALSDIVELSAQNRESMNQINALKEVVTVSKTMIKLREQQLTDLKDKLSEIEQSLADRETNLLSNDLRQEYERQLQNIRTLRGLYEERARLAEVTRQSLVRDLEEQRRQNGVEVNKCKELTDKVKDLEENLTQLEDTIENKNHVIMTCQAETRDLKAEMLAVNKLFSQVLLGYKSKQDLDTLVHRLEEHQGILTQMAERENGSEASSALPKLLLEIITQVEEKDKENASTSTSQEDPTQNDTCNETGSHNGPNTTAEEIVQKLPKVWKVLIELLSHQTVDDTDNSEKVTTCYKSVETKSGPVLVPSVSQTYIRLKDLIIEKLGLIKEVNRMKQLNSHLETRLEEQEKKLCIVSSELSKTWHVVGRLRKHHHQLHTHEKILKYELQQKRKLLNELKEELEYCREKWEQAREKNTQSEKDWRKLRAEFSSRKAKPNTYSINNSAESGYSDERPSDESSESNDESEYIAEPLVRCKKKLKKSIETILDSSTDFNLAAEREDPASDMLDVAELPLDTQEGDENPEACASESCNSENLLSNERICEETEDEVCDLAVDSCVEDISITENNSYVKTIPHTHTDTNEEQATELICDENSSQNNISHQETEDSNVSINRLDDNSSASNESQISTNTSKQINSNNCLSIRPTSSQPVDVNSPENDEPVIDTGTGNTDLQTLECSSTVGVLKNNQDHLETRTHSQDNQSNTSQTPTLVDFKGILASIKQQDAHLANKDKRLQSLEHGCKEVVTNITNTLAIGEDLVGRLDVIQNKQVKDEPIEENISSTNAISENPEPSTSSDHEARFAARDIRLKRLEEQTKSLVNKMNNTKTKRVKIHYKLEELHNIYGSENSRAGTPDSEDKSDKSDIDKGDKEN